jgi:hypothetical protein
VIRALAFVLTAGVRGEDVRPELGCSGRTAHRYADWADDSEVARAPPRGPGSDKLLSGLLAMGLLTGPISLTQIRHPLMVGVIIQIGVALALVAFPPSAPAYQRVRREEIA